MSETSITPPAQLVQPAAAATPVWIIRTLPGILLTAAIAAASYALRLIPGVATFSPMMIAILLGMAFHNVIGTPAIARPGVLFSLRRLLRIAVAMLGLQLTAQQVAALGGTAMGIVAVTLVATFVVTKAMGRLLGVDRGLAELIAGGTSICGASAAIAVNSVTGAPDEDVAYAVACVTVFGALSMFLYPVVQSSLLHLPPTAFGLWAGASIHEIAQVVAAAFQAGPQAGEFATIAKLSRIMLLAPMVLALGFFAARRNKGTANRARAPMPWFVFGFIALIAANSIHLVPVESKSVLIPATTAMLTMALAAMGLETDMRKLKARGLRPLALGAASWAFISLFSLGLILLVY